MGTINACLGNQLGQQLDETIHLRTPGDGAAESLVRTAGLALFLQLLGARLPIEANSFASVSRQLCEYGRVRHRSPVCAERLPGSISVRFAQSWLGRRDRQIWIAS